MTVRARAVPLRIEVSRAAFTIFLLGTMVASVSVAAADPRLGSASRTALGDSQPTNREILDSAGEVESYVPTARSGDTIPDVPLVDQNGRHISLRRAPGPAIVSFFETRCPDNRTCPLVTAKFGVLERMLRGTGIRLIEITLDPNHDRPSTLHAYAALSGVRGTSWRLATGTMSDIANVSERLGIFGGRTAAGANDHSESLAIVSGDGTVQTLVDGNDWQPVDVAAQARDAAGLTSNPLRRAALQLFARVSAACGGSGTTGISIVSALAVFAFSIFAFGYITVRTFSQAFADRL